MREKAQRELDRTIKLDQIKEKYLKFRNQAFAELYYEINQNTLNTINCKEISNSLLAKKVIKINKWSYKQLSILFLITGIIYGVLYWIFDSVKNASESTEKIIIGIIGGAVLFHAALRMALKPVELQTEEIFRGTGFSVNDLDSSIIECDDNILKLIKCSLDGDKAGFGEILKKVVVPLVTPPLQPSKSVTPPPLPSAKVTPPQL